MVKHYELHPLSCIFSSDYVLFTWNYLTDKLNLVFHQPDCIIDVQIGGGSIFQKRKTNITIFRNMQIAIKNKECILHQKNFLEM